MQKIPVINHTVMQKAPVINLKRKVSNNLIDKQHCLSMLERVMGKQTTCSNYH